MRVQEYEDEDEEDEPGPRTRVRSLLLTLTLQLHHLGSKVRERLQGAVATLGGAADQVSKNRCRNESMHSPLEDRRTNACVCVFILWLRDQTHVPSSSNSSLVSPPLPQPVALELFSFCLV